MLTPAIERVAGVHEIMVGSASMGTDRGPPRRERAAVAGAFERTEVRQSCASHNRLRKPYFGDLHVHTAYSVDAAVVAVSTGPRDAYRFAQGEEIGLPPFDPTGAPLRHARLSRPLDFNAVTDHAEFFGEMDICLNRPERRGSTSTLCTLTRNDVATFSDPATPARPRGPSAGPHRQLGSPLTSDEQCDFESMLGGPRWLIPW